MDDQEEKVLDKEQWKNEITAVIQDVKEYVKEIIIAEEIPSLNSDICCNLTTLEGEKFCIELTASGFRVVAHSYNDNSEPTDVYYETPYSLLDKISPSYRKKFSSSLAAKLQALSESQEKLSSNLEEPSTNKN